MSKKKIVVLPKDITTEELMDTYLGYSYTDKELYDDWNRLKTITKFKTGSQWKPGLKICQQFCDNFFDMKATNGKSFNSVKATYEEMDKIRKWGLEKMSALYISWIRRAIYMRWGGHNPTYYRPHLAKQIIASTNKTNGVLFDPCAGWGGRMLGTVSAGWKYIACEPNVETYNNLLRIADFLNIRSEVTIYNIPFEELDMNVVGKVDVVLTSPPYFNLEIYSDDNTQCYNKHDSYEIWLNNWFLVMVDKCLNILNEDGLSCWNVMDFKNINIVNPLIEKHNLNKFNLVNALGIDSPFINYKKKLNKKDLTYIFQKK
jgi:DNA modification methylase